MTSLRISALTLIALAGAALTTAPIAEAASPAQQTRLKSPSEPRPGDWYCIIWEKVDGKWVCRLQEKTL
ncbi:MAG: hypothetical protein ACKVP4_11055 [Hyphomicrobium sp.]